jgi:hypothetical protein
MFHLNPVVEQKNDIGRQIIGSDGKHTGVVTENCLTTKEDKKGYDCAYYP